MKKKLPNPGSDEAIELGCTCAVMDNGHGHGYMGMPGLFVYSCDCPVHKPVLDAVKKKMKKSSKKR